MIFRNNKGALNPQTALHRDEETQSLEVLP